MKIIFRSTVIWNLTLFLMFSFLLLHLCLSISNESSPFNLSTFQINMIGYKWILLVLLTTVLCTLNVKKISRYLYLFSVVSICTILVFLIFDTFSKLILVLLFFYTISAYYNYQLLNDELQESYYNSNFNAQRMFQPMLINIPCVIKFETLTIDARLTNWNENGCFVILENNQMLKGRCDFEVEYDGKVFTNSGHIVSLTNAKDGVGIKFFENNKTVYNWYNLNKILLEKGILPELVR